jgi:hypothetical protein
MAGRSSLLTAVALAALFASAPLDAAPHPAYLGSWLIAEVHPAPWVNAKDPATAPFDDHLVGRMVTYTPARIVAPRPLACLRPRYRWTAFPPEDLFQGGLTSPRAQAAALGFRRAGIPTLETGCEGPIDFHFTEAGTVLFALDNNIYTLHKRARSMAKRYAGATER